MDDLELGTSLLTGFVNHRRRASTVSDRRKVSHNLHLPPAFYLFVGAPSSLNLIQVSSQNRISKAEILLDTTMASL